MERFHQTIEEMEKENNLHKFNRNREKIFRSCQSLSFLKENEILIVNVVVHNSKIVHSAIHLSVKPVVTSFLKNYLIGSFL